MEDIKRKLTSRKFWVALAGFVAGLIVAFGGTEATSAQVTALIMSGASVVAYILGEGLIDAAGAKETISTVTPQETEPPDEDVDDGK